MRIRIGRMLLLGVVCAVSACAEETRPELLFLSKDDAAKAIVDDKSEPYFDTLEPVEMASKTSAPITGATLAEQRAVCRGRYAKAALEFTADDQALLRWAVEKIHPLVATDYPLYAKQPWTFLKISSSIEGGFPFTRGDCIIVPDGLLAKFAKFKAKSEDRTLAMLGSVLVHEQFHVFQRHHPDLVAKLYSELWGFKHVEKIESCEWLQARHLANPDGLDCRWVFPITENGTTRYIWPLVIFAETDTPQYMGPDFRMVALDLTETGKDAYKVQVNDDKIPKYADLMTVDAYKGKFSFWGEIFHPHEISAEFFSSIVLVDKLAPKGMIKTEKAEAMEKQIGPFRVWLREHCK